MKLYFMPIFKVKKMKKLLHRKKKNKSSLPFNNSMIVNKVIQKPISIMIILTFFFLPYYIFFSHILYVKVQTNKKNISILKDDNPVDNQTYIVATKRLLSSSTFLIIHLIWLILRFFFYSSLFQFSIFFSLILFCIRTFFFSLRCYFLFSVLFSFSQSVTYLKCFL